MHKPDKSEYPEYFNRYIDLVQGDDISVILRKQQTETKKLLDSINEEKAAYRYAPGKWSVREVVGHVSDVERIFTYRALHFARNDRNALPSFDENAYVEYANFDSRHLREITADFLVVRNATISLFTGFDPDYFIRTGIVNEKTFSVRAFAYIIAGHELHHRRIIIEKYL